MSATKFWAISGTGTYSPSGNMPQPLIGIVSATGITNVDTATIAAIISLGITGVNIPELGSRVSAATGTTISLGTTYNGITGSRTLSYYNANKPAFGIDGPITAIIPIASTPGNLELVGNNGNTAVFASGSLKQGTVYPFTIERVTSVTAGNFIGLSEF
jgi:hypothetical protein